MSLFGDIKFTSDIESIRKLLLFRGYRLDSEVPLSKNESSIAYKVIDTKTSLVAVAKLKKIPEGMSKSSYKKLTTQFEDDIAYCKKVSALEGMERLYNYYYNEYFILIITEFFPNGTIDKYTTMRNNQPMEEEIIQYICYHIMKSLLNIHRDNKSHKDIRPRNIMINGNGQPELGLIAINFTPNSTPTNNNNSNSNITLSFEKTKRYCSPEVLNEGHYSLASDIWSLGVVLLELAFGYNTFTDLALQQLTSYKVQGLFDDINKNMFNIKYSPKMIEFITKLFDLEPTNRPTLKQLLANPWIRAMPEYTSSPLLSYKYLAESQKINNKEKNKEKDKYLLATVTDDEQPKKSLCPCGRKPVHPYYKEATNEFPILGDSKLNNLQKFDLLISLPEFDKIKKHPEIIEVFRDCLSKNNKKFILHDVDLSNEMDDFWNKFSVLLLLLEGIEVLDISECHVINYASLAISRTFFVYPNLKSFIYCGNRLNDNGLFEIIDDLHEVKKLEDVTLTNNEITDVMLSLIIKNISRIRHVRRLDLSNNQISRDGASLLFQNFGKLPQLEFLSLAGNQIDSGAMIELSKYISNIKQIKILKLNDNIISDNGFIPFLNNIETLGQLTELYMHNNDLDDDSSNPLINQLKLASSLKKLTLYDNNFSTVKMNLLKTKYKYIE